MKVVSALKPLCKDCYIVRRGKHLYMRCRTQPRHKRRQGFATLNYLAPANFTPIEGNYPDGHFLAEGAEDCETAEVRDLLAASRCSHCAKSLSLDMSARIKVKQDFLKLVEESGNDK